MYIIDNQQQLERTKEMVPVRKNMETFEVFYHDPATGNLWKSFFPRGYKNHSGPKLLRPEPLPDNLELQLEMCLNSTVLLMLLVWELSVRLNPKNGKEFLTFYTKTGKSTYALTSVFFWINWAFFPL